MTSPEDQTEVTSLRARVAELELMLAGTLDALRRTEEEAVRCGIVRRRAERERDDARELCAQALAAGLEACDDARDTLEFTRQWWSVRVERLRDLAREHGCFREHCAIVANGTVTAREPPTYAQAMNTLTWRVEAAEKEVATMRGTLAACTTLRGVLALEAERDAAVRDRDAATAALIDGHRLYVGLLAHDADAARERDEARVLCAQALEVGAAECERYRAMMRDLVHGWEGQVHQALDARDRAHTARDEAREQVRKTAGLAGVMQMRELIRDLATSDPCVVDHTFTNVCAVCGRTPKPGEPRHWERCAWLRAREMRIDG